MSTDFRDALKRLLSAIEGWLAEPTPSDSLPLAMENARAVLAQPEPSAEEEAAELARWLRSMEEEVVWFEGGTDDANRLHRAAGLLESLAQPPQEGQADG